MILPRDPTLLTSSGGSAGAPEKVFTYPFEVYNFGQYFLIQYEGVNERWPTPPPPAGLVL